MSRSVSPVTKSQRCAPIMLLTVSLKVDGVCEPDESNIIGDLATSLVGRVAHNLLEQEVLHWVRRTESKSRFGSFTVQISGQVPFSQSNNRTVKKNAETK